MAPFNLDSTPQQSTIQSHEVQWQTIIFGLIGISLGSMFQPSGRVCGASSRYAPYLRSLPAVCVANTVTFLLRPILMVTLDVKTSVKKPWKAAIEQRYDDPETETREDMRKSLLGRWLALGTGIVFLGVKVAATKGISWSKAWGVMLLVPQVVLETMLFFPEEDEPASTEIQLGELRSDSSSNPESPSTTHRQTSRSTTDSGSHIVSQTPTQDGSSALSASVDSRQPNISTEEDLAPENAREAIPVHRKSDKWMFYIERVLLALALLFHAVVAIWAIMDILKSRYFLTLKDSLAVLEDLQQDVNRWSDTIAKYGEMLDASDTQLPGLLPRQEGTDKVTMDGISKVGEYMKPTQEELDNMANMLTIDMQAGLAKFDKFKQLTWALALTSWLMSTPVIVMLIRDSRAMGMHKGPIMRPIWIVAIVCTAVGYLGVIFYITWRILEINLVVEAVKAVTIDLLLWPGTMIGTMVAAAVIFIIARIKPDIAELLRINSPGPSKKGDQNVSWPALSAIIGFLANFVICVLWYALRFDGTGTIQPTWTGVFG